MKASNIAVGALAVMVHVLGVNGNGSPVMRPMSSVAELRFSESSGWLVWTSTDQCQMSPMRVSDAEAERVALYLAGLPVEPLQQNAISQWVQSRRSAEPTATATPMRDTASEVITWDATGKRPTSKRKGPPSVYNPKE